jgi:hypothetical protein
MLWQCSGHWELLQMLKQSKAKQQQQQQQQRSSHKYVDCVCMYQGNQHGHSMSQQQLCRMKRQTH